MYIALEYNLDTLLRQWAMLRLIPRHPRKIDSISLQRGLETWDMK